MYIKALDKEFPLAYTVEAQTELAEKAGISEGQFCQKLAGNYVCRQDEIDRICALLSIQPTDIGQYFFLPKKL